MRIIATSTYWGPDGRLDCQHQLVAEFDGEAEFPGAEGDPAKAVAIRSSEIGAVAKELLAAISGGMVE
jgi:hypothetical protein